MGDAAEDIYQLFCLTEEQVADYETVKVRFDDYFEKKKNIIYERAKFNMRKQEDSESVDSFVTALYRFASKCNYGALHDKMFQDLIVVGISNQALPEKM